MSSYSPLRFRKNLVVGLPEHKVDLSILQCAELASDPVQGKVWHFREPKGELSFKVQVFDRALNETRPEDFPIGRKYTSEEVELAMTSAIKEEVGRLLLHASELATETGKPADFTIPKDHPVQVDYYDLRESYKKLNQDQWSRGKQYVLSLIEELEDQYGIRLEYEEKNGELFFYFNGELVFSTGHHSHIEDVAPEVFEETKHPATAESQVRFKAKIKAVFQRILGQEEKS